MNITMTLYVTNRKDWRAWLEEHYRTEKEIWLIYYHKKSGKPRISYNEAVEEALCFGWIDSIVKKMDEDRFVQRFSPRNAQSEYSPTNKERLRKLIAEDTVKGDVRAVMGDIFTEQFKIPPDILNALRENVSAWENFRKYSDSYQRIRIGYIESARNRKGEFEKRLEYFLRRTERNQQFGFDIHDYY